MQPLVYVVVLNWNGYQDTMRCVASLERQSYQNRRIMIVDNGSTDGSVNVLRELADRVRLIELPGNLGYTGGNNRAMREAFALGAEYVWLFNNDALAEPDTLTRMISFCETDQTIGLASSLIREADDHDAVQFACGLFDLSVPVYTPCYEIAQAREWQAEYPERIALVGTAMLVRRALYEKIGGLEERLFAYWEDIDYSIRSVIGGFHNVVVFETSVFHPSRSATSAPNDVRPHYYYLMARNEILMWRSFCSPFKAIKAILWVLRRQLIRIRSMPDNAVGTDAVLAGLWDGCRGIGGRYDPTRRMPFPVRQMLLWHPGFWLGLIDAKR